MKKKLLVAVLCVVMMAVGGLATWAYLTSQDSVVNTFTVGDVDITLDEAKVNHDGTYVTDENNRVEKNDYHLLPGHEYVKDPTVTVVEGSDESYIRMLVTVSNSAELDAIFGANGAELMTIFQEYDGSVWLYKGNVEDTESNTRTYEFWYYTTVTALDTTEGVDDSVKLPPLFTSIIVPENINNDQLKTIEGMTISVVAHAIQADGFDDAADAWANF